MIKIGEFSKLSRVSIRMLRHYDELGLLTPVRIDPESGYRFYSVEQLSIVCKITALKDMGFSLSVIGDILSEANDSDIPIKYLRLKRAELSDVLEQTKYRLRLLDTALEKLGKEENNMKYDVICKTFPQRYAATVRMTIPSYENEGILWKTLMEETAHMNLVPDEPCYCCAVYHDRDYRETDTDVEIQKTIKGSYADTEHVRFRVLPEVTVASAVCKGSYSQMNEIMSAVAEWVIRNGYKFDGPAFNIYHVSPHETADENEFVTEICYPVRKK